MLACQNIITAAIFSTTILTTCLALAGQADRLPPENQCLTKAYSIDPSERGLNIRRQPSAAGKILGQLPKGTEVNVLGMQGNWILVSVVNPTAQKVDFQGEGWVFASRLGVSSKGYDRKTVSLYSQPSFRSKVTGTVQPNSETSILGCSGKWLKVKGKQQQQGWLEPRQQCAAPYTSCS
jgi:uncharacterized protein YgiM (DUF1202 family)